MQKFENKKRLCQWFDGNVFGKITTIREILNPSRYNTRKNILNRKVVILSKEITL